MKAILNINYHRYLIPDAKKALALVELLQKSQAVDWVNSSPDEVRLRDEAPVVSMETLNPKTRIIPARAAKAAK